MSNYVEIQLSSSQQANNLGGAMNPVMLWAATHVTLRYTEVPAAIEAGFQVIPTLGTREYVPFEPQFEDENWRLYPEWRAFCSLPTDAVEAIRRVRLDQRDAPLPTPSEQDLINSFVSVIYLPSFPEAVTRTLTWFKGIVVFRDFGRISSGTNHSDYCKSHGIQLASAAATGRLVYAPIFKSLLDTEPSWLTDNHIVIRGFVTREMVPIAWQGPSFRSGVSTMLKLTGNEAGLTAAERIHNLHAAIPSQPCLVLGKNTRTDMKMARLNRNFRVPGFLEDDDFFKAVVSSRAFIYLGRSPHHMHFTPLEAVTAGVPTLFNANCPLGNELSEEFGMTSKELRDIGGYPTFQDLADNLDRMMRTPTLLAELAQRQRNPITSVYSRERAVEGFAQLRQKAHQPRATWVGPPPIQPHPYREKPAATPPSNVGDWLAFTPRQFAGAAGQLIAEEGSGELLRTPIDGPVPGFLGGAYLRGLSGTFNLEIEVSFEENSPDSIGYVEVGAFAPEYVCLRRRELRPSSGRSSLAINFSADEESWNVTEVRVFVYGNGACTFHRGALTMTSKRGWRTKLRERAHRTNQRFCSAKGLH